MKKLSVLLCVFLLTACAPSEVPSDKLVERNWIKYEINSQTPFTGASIEYYENGQLSEKGYFKDGKPHGLAEVYHENGQLMGKVNYKDGEQHGLFESYHENGQLEAKVNFKDGEQHGLFESYHENGQLEAKVNNKDGEFHGLAESYDEDGKEYSSSPKCYQNGETVDMSNCK